MRISASFDNRTIEIIGYGFDYKVVNKYLEKFYDETLIEKRTEILFNRLFAKINELGLEFHIPRENIPINKYYEIAIYNELKKYPDNMKKVKEKVWDSFSDFLRKGLNNRDSLLFINKTEFYLSSEKVVNLIHENGGIALLAHPYQYKFADTEEFLDKIYNEDALDGIECFYTTFSEEQTNYLLAFAKKRNLLISGGSDYHGTLKQNHYLGVDK